MSDAANLLDPGFYESTFGQRLPDSPGPEVDSEPNIIIYIYAPSDPTSGIAIDTAISTPTPTLIETSGQTFSQTLLPTPEQTTIQTPEQTTGRSSEQTTIQTSVKSTVETSIRTTIDTSIHTSMADSVSMPIQTSTEQLPNPTAANANESQTSETTAPSTQPEQHADPSNLSTGGQAAIGVILFFVGTLAGVALYHFLRRYCRNRSTNTYPDVEQVPVPPVPPEYYFSSGRSRRSSGNSSGNSSPGRRKMNHDSYAFQIRSQNREGHDRSPETNQDITGSHEGTRNLFTIPEDSSGQLLSEEASRRVRQSDSVESILDPDGKGLPSQPPVPVRWRTRQNREYTTSSRYSSLRDSVGRVLKFGQGSGPRSSKSKYSQGPGRGDSRPGTSEHGLDAQKQYG